MYMYVENRVATRERLLLYYFITIVIIYCYNYIIAPVSIHICCQDRERIRNTIHNPETFVVSINTR